MNKEMIRERLNKLSRDIDTVKNLENKNQKLQDFLIWLVGYLDGLGEIDICTIQYTFDKDGITKKEKAPTKVQLNEPK